MNSIELANVNGRISAIDDAHISVTDHGFLYGDSVYETIRTYARRPFLLKRHLERLERSAAAIRLRLPWTRTHLRDETLRTLDQVEDDTGTEFAIRIMATRGNGPFGYDPDICSAPNLIILMRTLPEPSEEARSAGVPAVIASVRRNPIEALDPRIKSSNLLNNILAAQDAKDAGADEAILFNTAGVLAEATMSNVFFVAGDELRTPSLDCGLLGGLTRDLILDLAREDGMAPLEGRFDRREFSGANEIFLTSTTREILPITRLDGRMVGTGTPGPVTARLQILFRRRVDEFLRSDTESP